MKFSGRGGFPPTMRLRLKWSAAGAQVAAAAVTTYNVLGNSVYQPSTTFNSDSAFNFNSLRGMYKYFRVYASSFRARVSMVSTAIAPTATVIGGDMFLYPSVTNTSAVLVDAMQQPGVKISRISNLPKNIGGRATTKFMLSLDPSVDENLAGGASSLAQPSKVWWWNFGISPDAAYTSVSVYMDVTVEYDVEFFEYVPVIASLKEGKQDWRTPLGEYKSVMPQIEIKKEIKESPIIVGGERVKEKPLIKAMACKKLYSFRDNTCPGQQNLVSWGKGKQRTRSWVCTEAKCPYTPRNQPADFGWMKMDESMLTAENSVYSPFIWPSGDLGEWEEVTKESVDNQGPLVRGTGTSFSLSLR